MFKEVRAAISLSAAIEKYTSKELIAAGTDTLQLEDKECPFCGHRDCFKVRVSEEAVTYGSMNKAFDVLYRIFNKSLINLS